MQHRTERDAARFDDVCDYLIPLYRFMLHLFCTLCFVLDDRISSQPKKNRKISLHRTQSHTEFMVRLHVFVCVCGLVPLFVWPVWLHTPKNATRKNGTKTKRIFAFCSFISRFATNVQNATRDRRQMQRRVIVRFLYFLWHRMHYVRNHTKFSFLFIWFAVSRAHFPESNFMQSKPSEW